MKAIAKILLVCMSLYNAVISKRVESILLRQDFCRDCEREIGAKVSLREFDLSRIAGGG